MLTVFTDLLGSRRGSNRAPRNYRHVTPAVVEYVTDVLDAAQTVVRVLTDPGDGLGYTIRLSDKATSGATNLQTHEIIVSSKPLFDALAGTAANRAAVVCGLVCHEIGHTLISEQTSAILNRRWPKSRNAMFVANLLDDHRLERRLKERHPGIGPTFYPVRKYMAALNVKDGVFVQPVTFPSKGTLADRANFAIAAVRFTPFVKWLGNEVTRTEREWWIEWARTYTESDDADLSEAGIAAGLARLKAKPEPLDESEDGTGGESIEQPEGDDEPKTEPGEGKGKGKGKGGDKGEATGKVGLDPEDEDEDDDEAPGSGAGAGDEGEDDDESEDDDEDNEDWGDEPESEDADESDDDDDVAITKVPEHGTSASGSTGTALDPDAGTMEVDDIDPTDRNQGDDLPEDDAGLATTHLDADDGVREDILDIIEERINDERRSMKVNRGDGFGSMKITVID